MAWCKAMPSQAKVIRDYTSAYPDPIAVGKGERVLISHCDLQWRGWVWVTLASGKSGWAPQQLFAPLSAYEGTALDDYCAHELTVRVGETLTLIKALNGWYFARKTDGEQGWVPQEHIRLKDKQREENDKRAL
ncbi:MULTISPECIES: SH3 domain-containing protein [Kosakonia]|uniref:SH3 domain-containing protein n=1 Tax=Kosakonia TaxID=1330547 RepID=UPI000E05CF0C|nr:MULTISPECIES: SH3 domain-containing protein [Kosakonia]RCX06271.1 variant SH3 domain-containing protein [Kosakonia sp. AG348]